MASSSRAARGDGWIASWMLLMLMMNVALHHRAAIGVPVLDLSFNVLCPCEHDCPAEGKGQSLGPPKTDQLYISPPHQYRVNLIAQRKNRAIVVKAQESCTCSSPGMICFGLAD